MSVPLRKDDDFVEEFAEEENLTTADLAQSKRPATAGNLLKDDRMSDARLTDTRLTDARSTEARLKDDRPGPVLAERPLVEAVQSGTPSTQVRATDTSTSADVRTTDDTTPLFPNNELEELRNRWNGVQTAFVDEPRRAVEQADGLVASAMKRLAEVFAEERSKLEHQWDRGDNVSTEDLRIALQRYRTFFQRLLSI
jgi:hypothetical protein